MASMVDCLTIERKGGGKGNLISSLSASLRRSRGDAFCNCLPDLAQSPTRPFTRLSRLSLFPAGCQAVFQAGNFLSFLR